jgi:F-type H+-transporting ATPase subunit a
MTIYGPLEGSLNISWVIQSTLLTGFLLVLAGLSIRKRISAADGGIVPDEGLSLRNVLEILVSMIADLAKDRIGPEWRKFFPILGTMFFFILLANLLGLVPGVGGPTADANTTWAWAIIAWLVYTVVGIAKHKHNYLVKFMGPSFFEKKIGGRVVHFRILMPIFLILELPLDIARVFTLAVRLLANMFADHTVILVMLSLVPIGVPAIFMGLGLIISFLQAFIFTLLTMIYIGLALEEPH